MRKNRNLIREGFVGSDDPRFLNTESIKSEFRTLALLDKDIKEIINIVDTDDLYTKIINLRKLLEKTFSNGRWMRDIEISNQPFDFEEHRHLFITDEEIVEGKLIDLIPVQYHMWDARLSNLKFFYEQYSLALTTSYSSLVTASNGSADAIIKVAVEDLSKRAEFIKRFNRKEQKEKRVPVRPATKEELQELSDLLVMNLQLIVDRTSAYKDILLGIGNDQIYDDISAKLKYSKVDRYKELTDHKTIVESLLIPETTIGYAVKYIRAYVALLLCHLK